jgi:hypothetical protein
MIVIAMMMAATTQPAAIQKPPKTIQSTFRRMETGGMSFLQIGMARRRAVQGLDNPDNL